jgi:hypothetical protein
VVERNPRFKKTLGDVTFSSNTAVRWNDTQVVVKSVSTSGNRLSFDYFMCTQLGRAILAKMQDKEGQFIEWVKEVDPSRNSPDAGIYYLNVDYVNEQTRDLGLTVHKYKWKEGSVQQAEGTIIGLGAGIDGTTLTAVDGANGNAPVTVNAFTNFLYLLSPCTTLVLLDSHSNPLTPLTDYWIQRTQQYVIANPTTGGGQVLNIPVDYVSFTITDQDGYQLRQGIDWDFFAGPKFIKLADWSPAGSVLTANVVVMLNPATTVATSPENILGIDLQPGESLAPGQVFIHTSSGDFPNVTANDDGTITLPTLLQPGDYATYEVRIDAGQFKCSAKKHEISSLLITDPNTISAENPIGTPLLDGSGNQQFVVPGLWLAFGDKAVVGDQVAIIVSPSVTETYEVYGSKENLTFTLEVKSNDLQTSSDLAEMLKDQLLITGRMNQEADGLTIFEATRDFVGESRDPSNTATNYSYNISVTASADWKVYKPLVTRMVSFEITDSGQLPDFLGKLQMLPRMQALGALQFIPAYM